MKKSSKLKFFIVTILILTFTYLTLFGAKSYFGDREKVYVKGTMDIRWGIDISGGVEAVFAPEGVDKADVTAENIEAAKSIIDLRMLARGIADYEIYKDNSSKTVVVRFPWKSGETDFDPQAAVSELGETAVLSFRKGTLSEDPKGEDGNYTMEQVETLPLVIQGTDVDKAESGYQRTDSNSNDGEYVVQLKLKPEGKESFAAATTELASSKGVISIWMDNIMVSAPTVNVAITDGNAVISGSFTAESAQNLAAQINSGSLPFKMSVDSSKLQIITPTMGLQARDAMLIAGIIAFIIICIMMIVRYRVPGIIACIALMGQIAGMLACVSGFFANNASSTLTIPGIAGIILSIGMGVDANVITSERIKEELYAGKTLDGAIDAGYDNGFSAILDGNVTVIIVSLVLMGAFGSPDSIASKIMSPLLFMFDATITGSIYSFGFTLLMGVIFNFIMGVIASRMMLKGISKFKPLRRLSFYGGAKNA